MNKCTPLLLSALLLLALFIPLPVAGQDTANAAYPCTFSYDFTEQIPDVKAHFGLNELMMVEVSPAATNGYVTFTATGDDPYFKFGDAHAPQGTGTDLAYVVIRYRTTAKIGKGEFFTNRSGGAHWGDAGTHVEWGYKTDGEWHNVVIDCTSAWGKAANETLYAFRLDPLASGATAGDSIDIAYIRFFANEDTARAFAASEDPSLKPKVTTYTIDFVVDGTVVYAMTYTDDGAPFYEPPVPQLPGKNGVWEAYTLENGGDLAVNAIYTDIFSDPPTPDIQPITESEATTEAEVDPVTEPEQTAKQGCGAMAACAYAILLLVPPCLIKRKEKNI